MRRTLGVGLSFAALVVTAGVRAGPAHATTASPTPSSTVTSTPLAPSQVTVTLHTDGTDNTTTSLTLIADLSPAAAWGDVVLYDGSTEIASGSGYRDTWSWSTEYLSPGTHNLTVDFTPSAASGYAPSAGAAVWTVPQPATPAPAVSHSDDPQPVVVSVPSVKATSTGTSHPTSSPTSATPTASATVSPTSARTGGVEPTQGSNGGGPLPFTGLATAELVEAAIMLCALGAGLLLISRRRHRPDSGGDHR